jgi:hypothetical protein
MKPVIVASLSVFLLAACAGDEVPVYQAAAYQQVSVTTPGVTGAHCFMQSGDRSYSLATPAVVNVQRSSAVMDVTCFKGEHMVGNQKVRPSVAPREEGKKAECISCNYPPLISIAMMLDDRSMDRTLRQFDPEIQ